MTLAEPISWVPDIDFSVSPFYVSIADALARDVAEGRLSAGVRLPPHRDLARLLGVNVGTVTRAYAEAARRGLVDGEVGRGTFVRGGRAVLAVVHAEPLPPRLVDLSFNLPAGPPEHPERRQVLHSLAERADLDSLFDGYRAGGMVPHRETGARWLARTGFDADPARTLVCCGAQHALATVFATLCSAGDVVLAEEWTYAGMKALAGAFDLRLVGVEMDALGLRPDALEAACKRLQPAALYTMPTLQNPTGIVMPEERRRELVAVARAHGLALVEDDTHAFYLDDPPPPLARLAPERTYAISTVSKCFGPGLRVGWLHAPAGEGTDAPPVQRLTATLSAMTWMAPPIAGEIVTAWLADGSADRVVGWKREEVRSRRAMLSALLPELSSDSHAASPHVWLPLPEPWSAHELARRAEEAGVAVGAAELFVVGRAPAPHAVRACIGTPRTRAELERGLRALAGVFRGPAEGGTPFA